VVIYVGGVAELTRIKQTATHLEIGAAASLSAIMPILLHHYPDLQEMFTRFAAPPVRNAGTLGGNIANGSPIGDSMPALIALGATVILRQGESQRRLALENLYQSYGVNAMQAGEFLECIHVPLPPPAQVFRCYKLSKRFDEDISAVCMALAVTIEHSKVVAIRIGCGGLSEIPARARACEQVLQGKPWTEKTIRAAMAALNNDFTPISDMRASATYRRQVMQNLLLRFFIESTDQQEDTRVYDVRP
ncbi:MAG: xanthine dehydrogenase small subunit, partial [Gammaproteobacteria bacterium]|nr:xanthine dehydrogenase small subunit [Gammaproteobacteria bacterium]